jgi:hypothetical protein
VIALSGKSGWGFPEMLKFSLVAMFVLSLATLSAAAASLPMPA